ncbi:MAG: hypothetical protein A3F46_08480 [Legionellales bacterium RIFCSPHIGHO2_12_FULL_42_9]|nr:MAG: hypothetical protein A3F46_08480 [Legionellales bacterium RIFCSPHIGHO2_12_FULL_42_9]
MKEKLLLFLLIGVTMTCWALPTAQFLQRKEINYTDNPTINEILFDFSTEQVIPDATLPPFNEIKEMLETQAFTLNRAVINKLLTSLQCTAKSNLNQNTILTVIDYSLPSSEKRIWVFDLKQKKLLFHTYVSHGIKSGAAVTDYFSNTNDSKASSIGVYKTGEAYYGREGQTVRLDGLDKGFNDNAMRRYIVMHGGWYVDENFIKKYGRAGRSWGCPALPPTLAKPIINTIKENSLFVIYYPNDTWFLKSKFLNCNSASSSQYTGQKKGEINQQVTQENEREAILFADLNGNNRREENEPIIVVTADNYVRLFHTKVPVERMLRRQINQTEYIALNNGEFSQLVTTNNKILNDENINSMDAVYFVIPEVAMERGYYHTHMKIISLGKVKEVKLNSNASQKKQEISSYTVYFETKSAIHLRSTNHFIRWLGL